MGGLLKKDTNLLMGINALEELFTAHKERIVKVFVEKGDLSSRKKELLEKLEAEKIPLEYVDKRKLEEKASSDSHQSFVAQVDRPYLTLKEALEKNPSFFLILDQIHDPHNFGAILRACECFGATSVIYSKNKGCPITPVVTKVSSGATELVDLIRVSNIHDSVLKLKEEGYTIVAADCSNEAQSLDNLEKPKKIALILGSEEKGIQPILRKNADHLVYIPMKGQIDSLNVSQAAACFLFHFLR